MCGRYVSKSDKQHIAQTFHAEITLEGYGPDGESDVLPDYNVAPQTLQHVVRLNPGTGQRELTRMKWGFLPTWTKDRRLAYSTINARAETLSSNSIYRNAFKSHRCLIPADAFYEWQKLGPKARQPYAISMRDGSLFAFAGLWDSWRDRQNDLQIETFTIVTTDPNELMQPIHDRMPAILERQDYERWLNPADPAQLPSDLLRPYPAGSMKVWKVGRAVGNARNNSPDLLLPDETALPQEQTLFDL